MTQTSYPLAKSPILTPQQWSKMARNWLNTGIIKGQLNELQVYADSTGMQVKAKSGQAYLNGHFYESDAEEVLPISMADATNTRIDRIIVRLDYTDDSVKLAVLQGVPAVSPVAPALTQNTSRWEISLARISIDKNVSTIAAGNVTNERTYSAILNSSDRDKLDKLYISRYSPNMLSGSTVLWSGQIYVKGAYLVTVTAKHNNDGNHMALGTWLVKYEGGATNKIGTAELLGTVSKVGYATALSLAINSDGLMTVTFTSSISSTNQMIDVNAVKLDGMNL
jgi:hypothetical protein